MSWQTPKTDWTTDDGIMANDLNRIEGNTVAIRDNLLKLGVSYYANNATAGGGTYNIRVIGGNLLSQSAVKGPMTGTFDIQKVLSATTWAAGNATSSPCRCPGAAAVGSNQWWYVFVLYNPTTAAFDVCMDDNFTGSHISGSAITTAGFTMWKRVACQIEYGSGAWLGNTIGLHNHFYLAQSEADRGGSSGTITSGVTKTTALVISGLSGTPSAVPPGRCFPAILAIQYGSGSAGLLSLWSALHGTTYVSSIGHTLYMTTDNNIHEIITIIPDSSNQINAYTTSVVTYGYTVIGWIDNGED